MVFFKPPRPHPRFGESVYVDIDNERQEGKIYWIYGPDQFFLIGFNDSRYIDGIRFEVIPSNRVKLG